MPTCALVSRTDEAQRAELAALAGPGWDFVDCHADRERLARLGDAVEVVYGNVRAHEFPALANLRFVQASWAGIDNLLHPALRDSDVLVANVRGAYATLMSEHVVAGLLYFARELGRHATARTWKPERREWRVRPLAGEGVCVFGAGSIAAALIPRLNALGMRVHAVNRGGAPVAGAEVTVAADRVAEILPRCRDLVLLAPATPETAGVVDRAFLARMQGGGILVNVSRGSLLVEADLRAALDAGELAGACLDVTDPEPPPDDSPLWKDPRILLTGHCAAMGGMREVEPFDVFRRNFRCWLAGDRAGMINLVDKRRGY